MFAGCGWFAVRWPCVEKPACVSAFAMMDRRAWLNPTFAAGPFRYRHRHAAAQTVRCTLINRGRVFTVAINIVRTPPDLGRATAAFAERNH